MQTRIRITIVGLFLFAGCAKKSNAVPDDAQRKEMLEHLEFFETYWLHHARIAPPTIPFEPQRVTSNGLSVTARPILAEDQSWNHWTGDGFRLFNNRIAHLFHVTVSGAGSLEWDPSKSGLRVNYPDVVLAPAVRPDELLEPLRTAALTEQQWMLSTEFAKRHRSAGAFRQEYFPSDPRLGRLEGIIGFPASSTEGTHIVAVQLDIAIITESGTIPVSVIFE